MKALIILICPVYPFYACFTCYLSDLISEELRRREGCSWTSISYCYSCNQSSYWLVKWLISWLVFERVHYCTPLVWSFKTMTFGNIYFKQNANSQTHIDVLTIFHFFTAHFIHLLKRLTKSATAPSSLANPTAVCPQRRTLLSSIPLIGSSVWAVAPVWVDKEQRTSPGGENKD